MGASNSGGRGRITGAIGEFGIVAQQYVAA